eukprot:scaffold295645_cov27-Tisochrysis_lutea.AAC.1
MARHILRVRARRVRGGRQASITSARVCVCYLGVTVGEELENARRRVGHSVGSVKGSPNNAALREGHACHDTLRKDGGVVVYDATEPCSVGAVAQHEAAAIRKPKHGGPCVDVHVTRPRDHEELSAEAVFSWRHNKAWLADVGRALQRCHQ